MPWVCLSSSTVCPQVQGQARTNPRLWVLWCPGRGRQAGSCRCWTPGHCELCLALLGTLLCATNPQHPPQEENIHLQLKIVLIGMVLDTLSVFFVLFKKKMGLLSEECTLFKHCLEGTNISSTSIYFLVIYCQLRIGRGHLLHFYSSLQCQSH